MSAASYLDDRLIVLFLSKWYNILMQKYIAVINPRMDDDEISQHIAKDIAGAIFQISHQNFALANKLIQQVKELSKIHKRPISIIQDVSEMEDPLELEFGMKSGSDWIVTDKAEHLKMAKGLDKLAKIIFKGRNLPKGIRVDSVMSDSFLDPDAEVMGHKAGQIKHIITDHKDQQSWDSILDIASHAGSNSIAVSDLNAAKALSWRRPNKKIIFAPKDHELARKGAILWGVHPIYRGTDLVSSIKNVDVMQKGERVLDATNAKHIKIHVIP
jgi:pyruvate kinase